MTPRDIEKLLGGYATGTLTPEERAALFAAALENQALFDALADEEALRELLSDPRSRMELLAALRAPEPAPRRSLWAWLAARPVPAALAASILIAVVAIGVLRQRAGEPRTVAMRGVETGVVPPEESAPAPTPRARRATGTPPAPAGAPPRTAAKAELADEARERDQPPAVAALREEGWETRESPAGTAERKAAAPQPASASRPAEAARPTSALAAAAGFEWTLLRAHQGGDYRETSEREFPAGDALRLRVRALRDGRLQLAETEDRSVQQKDLRAGETAEFPIPAGAGVRRYRLALSDALPDSNALRARPQVQTARTGNEVQWVEIEIVFR